eukprot:232044-Prorocentrum_lima.AAC.1
MESNSSGRHPITNPTPRPQDLIEELRQPLSMDLDQDPPTEHAGVGSARSRSNTPSGRPL